MSLAHRLPGFTCVFLVALPCFACAAPAVEVERIHGVFHVRVEAPVAVDALTAWRVLTDYDHLAEFVPDMHASRVVSAPGERLLLRQQGEAGFLFFRSRIDVLLEVEETPPSRLDFRAVGGNMKRMQGGWRVQAAAGGVNLVYEAQLEPDFWVPPLIGSALMRRDVGRQVAGVVQEMERRQGEGAAPVK